MRGHFITFEGGEGCGKSTQIKMLADALHARGIEVVLTREPGGTLLGEAIRGLLQHDTCGEPPCPSAEVLLFGAARTQLVNNVIRPALERGAWVLSDRFFDSTYAYQGYGRGFDLGKLKMIMNFATGGLSPDMTFLLDADSRIEKERLERRIAAGQAADRFEREADDFHERVRNGFRKLADDEPERFRVIDTSGAIEETAGRILSELSAKFGLQ